MHTRLVVLRHAESEGNANHIMQGCGEYPLSEKGRTQAAAAFPIITTWPVTLVAASNLSRARDTAMLATGRLDTTDSRLREVDAGPWEGRPRADLEAHHPGALEDDNLRPAGFEPVAAVATRMLAVCAELAVHPGLVVAFTHGGVLRVLARELGESGTRFGHLEGLWLDADLTVLGRTGLLTNREQTHVP